MTQPPTTDARPDPRESAPALRATPIAAAEKDALVAANRQRLEQDLIRQRLVFESTPRVVDLQLTNFCNMSCTMCYDGHNPPMQKMAAEVVEKVACAALPAASVVVPFAGSEPLIVTWDLARTLAERYGVELDIVTNAQFLDEAKFREVEPHVTTISFSIDSHMRDVYERIRLRSRPDKVFANLPRAAQLCREHGIEPEANVVFMVENAPWMDETVAFLADQGCRSVRILTFHVAETVPHDRKYSDPVRYLAPEWMAWMRDRIRRVAEQKKIRLIFDGVDREDHDFRNDGIQLRRSRKADNLHGHIGYFFPGYCLQSMDRIKVHADGDVYPCCVAEGGHLRLGNLHRQSFDEVWNGPESRDLRRAMLTDDLPAICRGCSFHTTAVPPEREHLPFVDWYHDVHCGGALPPVPPERRTLAALGPDHASRWEQPPELSWTASDQPVDEYRVVLSFAGTHHDTNRVLTVPGDVTSLALSDELWQQLQPNLAYWWAVWGVCHDRPEAARRTARVRCLVRHQAVPRVAGSTLYDREPAAPA